MYRSWCLALTLAGAYAIDWLWSRPVRSYLGRAAAVGFFFGWSCWLLFNSRLIWNHVEYRGAVQQIADVAALFPAHSVLLFVDPAPVGLGAVIGTPLQYLHHLDVFDLQEETLDRSSLERQVQVWAEEGRPVYIVSTPGVALPLPTSEISAVTTVHISMPLLEQTYEHPPAQVLPLDITMDIYEVTSSDSSH